MGRRSNFLALCWAFFASVGLFAGVLQAQTPSAQQLELLRSMSPAEREALLRQFGVAGEGDDAASSADQSRRRTNKDSSDRTRQAINGDSGGEAVLPATFAAGDTVVVELTPKSDAPRLAEVSTDRGIPTPELTEEEKGRLAQVVDIVSRRNPYVLDSSGALLLPGFEPIPLAGLTEEQGAIRVTAERSLRGAALKLVRLPVAKAGTAGLKPFGYELFRSSPSTFAPVTDVPVPSDYIVGIGDQLSIQLYGSQNRTIRLSVGGDGAVPFPEIGPISVAGKRFNDVRMEIEGRVSRQLIGVQANVGLSDTRSIRVFVLGEVDNPGSYTVSGLSSIVSALYAAGGIKTTGSLRNIELKRQGSLVRRFDLYDFLLRGDSSNDAKLQSGDVVFIPPVGATVAVEGEIRRPAIYEIKGSTTLPALLALAGGLTADADAKNLTLIRIGPEGARRASALSMSDETSRVVTMIDGDRLRVPGIRPTLDAAVEIQGHVHRPGPVAWRPGLRVSGVFKSVEDLKANADLRYVLIRREDPVSRRTSALSADLEAALRSPGSADDLELAARDRIVVFDLESGRRQVLDPIIQDLRRQATLAEPTKVVSISGRVKLPGDYPLETEMRVTDLLRAAGGMDSAAFGVAAELTRFSSVGSERVSELVEVDLAAISRGEAKADVVLQPFDFLVIKELPEWSRQEQVTLRGEVRFPGTYPLRRGETLRSVLERAGGLSALAFTRGSVFMRKELQEREAERIADLTARLQNQILASSIQLGQSAQGGQAAQGASTAQSLVAQLKTTKAVGRLVVDIDRVLSGSIGSSSDLLLRDGDVLVVPKISQEVTVIGEVNNGTSHLYRSGLSRDDYIALSGGMTSKADKRGVYVVRADGSVVASKSGFFGKGDASIQPGDTIVAPLDTDRLPPLPLWQAVSTIIYNAAVAIVAIGTL